jgi:hypothetical protein
MGGALYVLLREHCPPELRVLMAPFAVVPARLLDELRPG